MIGSRISLSTAEKLGIISNLSTMLAAGIPIIETVDSLLEDSSGNQRKLLETLRESLMQGNHISTVFAKFPNIFDKVTINLIEAAEEAGTLDQTFADLRDNIKNEKEFNDKFKSALTYPAFILVVFIGVLLMILTVVVPKISTVFSRLSVELPVSTQILIATSNLLLDYTIPVVGTIVISLIAFIFFYKKQKRLFLSIMFSVPLISDLVKKIDLTRFSRSMYLLLSAGITINGALELAQEVVIKKEILAALTHSRDVVLSGRKFSEGLKDAKGIIPSIMIKIVEAGEKSGSLDNSMQDISEYLDYEVSNSLRTITSLIEPIMLVFVGVLVGGMMLSIISPIYGMIGQIGNR